MDLSLRGEKILALESLCILKEFYQSWVVMRSNKTVTNAQRYITGLDVDFLNIHCENERNINFVNRKQNTTQFHVCCTTRYHSFLHCLQCVF